jgi:hypothetical protein
VTADTIVRSEFGRWCLTTLFEPERGPAISGGQWGGGMYGWWTTAPAKPAEYALTKHPIPSRVLLPTLLERFTDDPPRFARMMFLFSGGFGYRLPPAERDQLRSVVARYRTPDGGYRPLLELGRDVDPLARELLDGMDEDD